jgi:ABC-type sulfate transport system permease component
MEEFFNLLVPPMFLILIVFAMGMVYLVVNKKLTAPAKAFQKPDELPAQVLTVITAAIAAANSDSRSTYVITTIKRLNDNLEPGWNRIDR